jgi:hypothetical protein
MYKLFVLCLMLTTVNVFAGGKTQKAPDITPDIPPFLQFEIETSHSGQSRAEQSEQGRTEQSRAELVMKALAAAYYPRIQRVEFRNGDWAVLLRDTWYYYADSRLLPENLRGDAAKYNPHTFYFYQSELPSWRRPSAEEAARYRSYTDNRTVNPITRSPHFYDDLLRAHNRDEAYERVKSIRFLGKPVLVHYSILENLSLVEERVLAAAKADPQVQAWINTISTLEGWYWRNIADTQTRSFHSYGIAIDIIPRTWGGKETYWMWAIQRKPDWWNIPYSDRYHFPAAVIKAFEAYGFAWGGKWTYFDTMHFEYRPEVFILNGMKLETLR